MRPLVQHDRNLGLHRTREEALEVGLVVQVLELRPVRLRAIGESDFGMDLDAPQPGLAVVSLLEVADRMVDIFFDGDFL